MLDRNATLQLVTGAGAGESYDGPAAAGAQKFAGEAEAYLRERRDRSEEAAAGGTRRVERILIVPLDLAVDWRSGDVVTFERHATGETITAAVQLVERAETDDPEIPADVQTVRLTLETA